MVAEAANATVSVLRSTGRDKYGQPLASTAPIYIGPAVLVDTLSPTSDPSTITPRGARTVECHLPAYVRPVGSDQVRDEATGAVYLVSDIATPATLIGAPVDTVVTLQRVNPT